MKSAGNWSLNFSRPPDADNPTGRTASPRSRTSSRSPPARAASALPSGRQVYVTLSMYGLWISNLRRAPAAFVLASSQASSSLDARLGEQFGIAADGFGYWRRRRTSRSAAGCPSALARRAQSTFDSRNLPIRPSRMCSGIQLICRLFFSISSLKLVVRMNQLCADIGSADLPRPASRTDIRADTALDDRAVRDGGDSRACPCRHL